ncbi:MAG: AraC family transcriptional regulator, partial [Clostridiaceae bacterium]|nr:AraC family transcriptional regulator [Clostridiaceae bacterium]
PYANMMVTGGVNINNIDENCKKNVVSQIEIKIAILNILAVLYNNNLLVNECGNVDNYKIEYIKKVILYIENNYKRKICVKELAKEINMNEQYFCRFFKNIIGKSPMQYINEYRIKKSEELLKKTDMKIMQICLESGFNNMGNFINTFKKQTGLSPMKYRKDNKEDVIKM